MVLTRYIEGAMKKARYQTLADGTCFGTIPGSDGVWANERTSEKCRQVLRDVLEEWLLLKLRDSDPIAGLDDSTRRYEFMRNGAVKARFPEARTRRIAEPLARAILKTAGIRSLEWNGKILE